MHVMRSTMLAAALCVVPVIVAAQNQPSTKQLPVAAHEPSNATPGVPDIPYTKFVLGNGLTVLVHEDHTAPIVAVNLWYHVGSKNEVIGKTGFAHLFEHLMFAGS